jgi:ribose transport system permease protein
MVSNIKVEQAVVVKKTKEIIKKYAIFFVLIIICTFMSFASPYFFTLTNIINVLRQISIIAIISVGVSFIILTGGIDLSLGSAMALGGVLVAWFTRAGTPSWISVIITLLIGMLFGLIIGLLIVKTGINAFITTLAMLNIFRGIAYLITGGMPISFNEPASFLGSGYIGMIPFSVFLMFAIAIIGEIFASKTIFGRNIYAVGNNAMSANMVGIKVNRVKYFVYALGTCLAFFAGIITAGKLLTADPSVGVLMELNAIAAAVIGGISLNGGRGSIATVLIGAAIMGVMRNGFVLLKVSAYSQIVAIGLIILIAVGIDSSGKKET